MADTNVGKSKSGFPLSNLSKTFLAIQLLSKESAMINVKVNQEQHQFPDTFNIQSILNELNIAQNGIAVAINETIVSKEKWNTTGPKNNDNILIIKATQGG